MDHSFKIVGIQLNEAHFAINNQYKREKNKVIDLTHSIEVGYKHADKVLRVLVLISSDSENLPFRFSVAWEGAFAFDEMPSDEELERIARINCASIIFPYVRETIADLTRRANMTPLNLPPLNFVALYEESQQQALKIPLKNTRTKRKE
ncbi:protein-export chaperone SecB [Syntrophus aciditrophicus]|uniref:Protein translocase subunit n=1 Tax=Syntrophus aciditrophicus (strain SB) TaxID=56780 RepID=Q2LYD2_SYNAS|nr:protein-export chaperone SecB [Syntrophus aciditrophicus]ABC75915.1 protein translocase subunit [Syntrophus aciditrophicus SB]